MRGLGLDLWDEAAGKLMSDRGVPEWGHPGGTPPWAAGESFQALRSYAGCRAGLSRSQMGSQIDTSNLREGDSNLVFLDGERHKRLRSILLSILPDVPTAVASSSRFIDSLVEGLPTPARLDIVSDFAVPVAEDMALTVLGLGAAEHGHIAPMLSAMSVQFDPASDRAALGPATEAVHEFLSFIRVVVRRKEFVPGGGIDQLNQAMRAREISLREMLTASMLLAHASFQNSVNALSFVAVESLTNPMVARAMKTGDPSEQAKCVEELLRVGSPAQLIGRRSHADMTFDETSVADGDLVIICLAEANRDPTIFDQPEEFNPSANRRGHLAFGAGAHLCLGAALARGELRSAVRSLTSKYSTVSVESVTWGTNMVMFGPTSLVATLAA
jgi:cytochrome P450